MIQFKCAFLHELPALFQFYVMNRLNLRNVKDEEYFREGRQTQEERSK